MVAFDCCRLIIHSSQQNHNRQEEERYELGTAKMADYHVLNPNVNGAANVQTLS